MSPEYWCVYIIYGAEVPDENGLLIEFTKLYLCVHTGYTVLRVHTVRVHTV